MKIKTLNNRIRVEIDENKAGNLDLSNYPTAVECGKVVDVGENVELPLKKGDRIFFKSWAVDIVDYLGIKYYFIAEDTGGICAIINE